MLTIRDADFGMDDHLIVDDAKPKATDDAAAVGVTDNTVEPQAAVLSGENSAATIDKPVSPNSG